MTVSRGTLADAEIKKVERLLGPAQQGNAKALAELRPLLDRGNLWEFVGDLARRVEESWLDAMTMSNKLVREGYKKRAAAMRAELLAQGDSQLERLLVERVVMTWLQVCHADTGYAAALRSSEGHSFRDGEYQQQRMDRANARHLKALKALATVRKLLVPAVQINVGQNQIINQQGGNGSPDQ